MKNFKMFILSFCLLAVLFSAFAGVAGASADDAPDAWVRGLWIKVTELPEDVSLEDYSDGDDEEKIETREIKVEIPAAG